MQSAKREREREPDAKRAVEVEEEEQGKGHSARSKSAGSHSVRRAFLRTGPAAMECNCARSHVAHAPSMGLCGRGEEGARPRKRLTLTVFRRKGLQGARPKQSVFRAARRPSRTRLRCTTDDMHVPSTSGTRRHECSGETRGGRLAGLVVSFVHVGGVGRQTLLSSSSSFEHHTEVKREP